MTRIHSKHFWNRNASNIVIYCPEGQEDSTPGMFLEVKRIKPQRGESVSIQIVVDRDDYAFGLNVRSNSPQARGPMAIFALVDALVASKKSFVVQFPNTIRRRSFRFSTHASRSDGEKLDIVVAAEAAGSSASGTHTI